MKLRHLFGIFIGLFLFANEPFNGINLWGIIIVSASFYFAARAEFETK